MIDRTIYERAADVLRERGWKQYDIEICLEGALHYACHGSRHYCDTESCNKEGFRAERELEQVLGVLPCCWNDYSERTKEDVFTLLKFAAADELDTWRKLYGPEADL